MRRLGLYLGRLPGFDKAGFDRRELVECVRAADACGYDSFWMPEAWERDAFTLLAELATKTERIGLGTGIVNVFSRSPALIAMSAATIDEISGGRFRLGLGTSGARVIEVAGSFSRSEGSFWAGCSGSLFPADHRLLRMSAALPAPVPV